MKTEELLELFKVCAARLGRDCAGDDELMCKALKPWREICQTGGVVEFRRDADSGALSIVASICSPLRISQKMKTGEVWYNTVVDAPFQIGTSRGDGFNLKNLQSGAWEEWTAEDIDGIGGVDEGVWVRQEG